MATRYEPIWRCDLCTSSGLFADTHRCCPNCGHARDEEHIRFPEWDQLVSPREHRFHGASAVCCGQGWSAHARHCGGCGGPLSREGIPSDHAATPASAKLHLVY